MTAFKALLKQLQQLSKKKGVVSGYAQFTLTERQREELLELRRASEKEIQAAGLADDVYLRDYV